MKLKKGVMGEIIGVFVLILVISVLAGMTFLFTSQLKTQSKIKLADTAHATNEAGFINSSGYTLLNASLEDFSPTITSITNTTSGEVIPTGNYTLTGSTITNATATNFLSASINVTYRYTGNYGTAYAAVNKTEIAGATIINYLPLLFLAIIFGAILAVVLKIILPYINLGNQVSGF